MFNAFRRIKVLTIEQHFAWKVLLDKVSRRTKLASKR